MTTKKYIIAFPISLAFLSIVFYACILTYGSIKSYEIGKLEAEQLTILNEAEQLKMAINTYQIMEKNPLDKEFIKKLIKEKHLVEHSISLKEHYNYYPEKDSLVYTKNINCEFMLKNLNKYIHQKLEDNKMNCQNKTLTYFVNKKNIT